MVMQIKFTISSPCVRPAHEFEPWGLASLEDALSLRCQEVKVVYFVPAGPARFLHDADQSLAGQAGRRGEVPR